MNTVIKHASFKMDRADWRKVEKVVDRAVATFSRPFSPGDRQTLEMDLVACHCNGCPMDWDALLLASDFEFVHDVAGIQRHIHRLSGELQACFRPRFAVRP